MNAAKHVLFIQGGGEGAFDADKPLVESLRRSLGQGYRVHYPAMPSESDPNDELWRREIRREFEKLGGDALLVGHSVGAYILLKFILSDRGTRTLPGIFLMATPFVGQGGWQLNDIALPENFADNLPSSVPIFLYHARDDEMVPFAHLDLYRRKVWQATIRELKSGGHQMDSDLSVVAADIKRTATLGR